MTGPFPLIFSPSASLLAVGNRQPFPRPCGSGAKLSSCRGDGEEGSPLSHTHHSDSTPDALPFASMLCLDYLITLVVVFFSCFFFSPH